jgi:hypothetical protein
MSSFPQPSIVILVPIYRNDLTASEKNSLAQCWKVLGHYPIVFVKPESLSLESIVSEFPELSTHSFPDSCFTGTDSYNRLLISNDFYQPFREYEHILIYQLDAFVFRDELPYWCSQGLDYVGSPTIHKEEFDALTATHKDDYAEALSTHRLVFNGGLSLRRVAGMLRYLRIYSIFYPAWKGNEDMLFSQEATRLKPMKFFIKLPDWEQALRFSFEKSPAASYELTNHSLPFGCHAWERYDPKFWESHIPQNHE